MRRVQGFLKVARFQNALLVCVVAPYARKAIGLKLDAHRRLVGLRLAHLLAHLVEFRQDAQKILDMVAHFMRQNIGLREIARSAKAIGKLLVEAEVDIKLMVAGTVERAGSSRSIAAGRTDLIGKQHHRRRRIGLAARLENTAPDIFCLGQNGAGELRRLVIGDSAAFSHRTARALRLHGRAHAAVAKEDGHRIDANRAQHEEHDDENENAGNSTAAHDPEAGAAETTPAAEAAANHTTLLTAQIFNIVALPTALPAH